MRSVENTRLTCGVMAIPVKVGCATESHDEFDIHDVHGTECGGLTGNRRYCKKCGETDTADTKIELASGVERDDETVAVLTEGDFADVEPDVGRDIEILKFVPAKQIDPLTLGKPYFLQPEPDSSSYPSLRQEMAAADKVAMCRWFYRGHQYLAVLRASGKQLTLQNRVWPDELRQPDFVVPDKVDPQALKMARMVIEEMCGDFDSAEYVNGYAQRMREMIDAQKAAGDDSSEDPEVAKMLADLEASVAKKRGRK
jgi:DNA end-binding protein Ku